MRKLLWIVLPATLLGFAPSCGKMQQPLPDVPSYQLEEDETEYSEHVAVAFGMDAEYLDNVFGQALDRVDIDKMGDIIPQLRTFFAALGGDHINNDALSGHVKEIVTANKQDPEHPTSISMDLISGDYTLEENTSEGIGLEMLVTKPISLPGKTLWKVVRTGDLPGAIRLAMTIDGFPCFVVVKWTGALPEVILDGQPVILPQKLDIITQRDGLTTGGISLDIQMGEGTKAPVYNARLSVSGHAVLGDLVAELESTGVYIFSDPDNNPSEKFLVDVCGLKANFYGDGKHILTVAGDLKLWDTGQMNSSERPVYNIDGTLTADLIHRLQARLSLSGLNPRSDYEPASASGSQKRFKELVAKVKGQLFYGSLLGGESDKADADLTFSYHGVLNSETNVIEYVINPALTFLSDPKSENLKTRYELTAKDFLTIDNFPKSYAKLLALSSALSVSAGSPYINNGY